MNATAARSDWLLLSLVIILTIAVKAWLLDLAGIELHFDEAQYWEWSQQLDWNYYSKGPLTAWLIALSAHVFGHGEWQVRLPGWIAHGLFLACLFAFSRAFWSSRAAGWWALALGATTPMYSALSLVMTPDNLLLLCWTFALWSIHHALVLNHRYAWYGAGLAVGVGALGKLSIGLLPAFTAIVILLRREWWHHLRQPALWGGLALTALCMVPMLVWNASHDWVTLRHEAVHVSNGGASWLLSIKFLGGQIGALSPLVVGVAVLALHRRPEGDGQRLLWWLGLTGLVFFLFKASGSRVQPNWPAPIYVAWLVLLAGRLPSLRPASRRVVIAGMASSLVLLSVALFSLQWHIRGDRDPLRKLKYWSAPVAQLAGQIPPPSFVLTDTYHLAGELAFYWPRRIPVYIVGDGDRRANQHDLWPGPEREAGRDGLFVCESSTPPRLLSSAFSACTPQPAISVMAPDGALVRTLYAHSCRQYRPVVWPKPQHY